MSKSGKTPGNPEGNGTVSDADRVCRRCSLRGHDIPAEGPIGANCRIAIGQAGGAFRPFAPPAPPPAPKRGEFVDNSDEARELRAMLRAHKWLERLRNKTSETLPTCPPADLEIGHSELCFRLMRTMKYVEALEEAVPIETLIEIGERFT